MLPPYSISLKKIVKKAFEYATSAKDDRVDIEHLFLALIDEDMLVREIITNLGASIDDIKKQIVSSSTPVNKSISEANIMYDEDTKKVFRKAGQISNDFKHDYVGPEHLLLAILEDEDSLPSRLLSTYGIAYDDVYEMIKELLGVKRNKTNSRKKISLRKFAIDLTQLAIESKLDPIIGREKEIERIIHILSRRKKNNPLLIGEAGVGKTAIVEGLAQKIAKKEVPFPLLKKRIFSVDIGAMVAGTKLRGQFEERFKGLIKEAKEDQDIILFFDEIHMLVGAGAGEGAVDASNMIKPALARAEIKCIGATTPIEYRKYIERNSALERRFQPINIAPPNISESIEILNGIKKKYEEFHKVKYTDKAIQSAVHLTERYITYRNLPDKAIDVIDEAGASVKLKNPLFLPELKELEEKKKELLYKKQIAVKNQAFEKAAIFRDKIKEVDSKISSIINKTELEDRIFTVSKEDIAEIISSWTSIPLSNLRKSEFSKLTMIEKELRKYIIGQDRAIKALALAIRRGRVEIKDPKRPIGSFIFAGPTGVGKTELARVLAKFLFLDENALIRIDMSEYMEKFSSSRLIGAPPGYVGYGEGGQLTEAVRRRPYSVVLFDEIEKAHPDIFNLLLQILDNGEITDGMGRKIDFRNTIIILTANIGSNIIYRKGTFGFYNDSDSFKFIENKFYSVIKKTFRPEFINRIDDIIIFKPLNHSDLEKIVEILLSDFQKRLKTIGIDIQVDKDMKNYIIKHGFSKEYGAREIKRTIQRYIEDVIADKIIERKIKGEKIKRILIGWKDNKQEVKCF